jgi:hypothetical protein
VGAVTNVTKEILLRVPRLPIVGDVVAPAVPWLALDPAQTNAE